MTLSLDAGVCLTSVRRQACVALIGFGAEVDSGLSQVPESRPEDKTLEEERAELFAAILDAISEEGAPHEVRRAVCRELLLHLSRAREIASILIH